MNKHTQAPLTTNNGGQNMKLNEQAVKQCSTGKTCEGCPAHNTSQCGTIAVWAMMRATNNGK